MGADHSASAAAGRVVSRYTNMHTRAHTHMVVSDEHLYMDMDTKGAHCRPASPKHES